ncbi:putative transcription factor interactor and regulator CCHC(Zn) family [Helianthus annuus]|uniref:Transcription factor interactor and regulator CCHC(Zn) family n=1 Tax=Helianthus annuus TaxID=4232 RepID=A0A9K3J803_HELAN|nr:putative transcription factor interactor and regulator CCHC(Zn) family [Helianthus annuus]
MPPRRDQAQDAALAALIAQQFAAVLPNLIAQINQANNNNNNVQCTFKTFNSAKPLTFTGSEGATGLLQWFESLESTFRHVQCPNERKVEFASSVFQKRALTWWNGIMRDRGADVAMTQTWEELRALMMKEFCPRHELRALEREFDDLKQDSGEHRAYTDRYEELSLLCPTMVTPLDKAIERYIDGLPDPVQDIVTGSNPTTVRQAIELSATLTESQIRKGKLFRKGDPRPSDKTAQDKPKDKQTESSKKSKKRKASQNFAVVAQNDQVAPNQPAQPRARKNYVGTAPLCNKCNRHHVNQTPCQKCTHCGRLGHLVNTCRHVIQNQNVANPAVVRAQFPPGSCYNCGDLTHYRNNCPRLVNTNPARGRVFNINEANANDNAAVNN